MIIDGKKVMIAGVAKGSGMIHPNMATMLSFITTDARIEHDVLQTALSQITNHTFNQITVDGDTSRMIWSSLWQVDYQKRNQSIWNMQIGKLSYLLYRRYVKI